MIIEILLIAVYAVLFNWAVNMQVLAISEKNRKDKTTAILISLSAAIILGVITRI